MSSLFLITGNLSLRLRKGFGISALNPPGGSSFEGFPCIFPVDQGPDRRDEFAPDCPHRHTVCRCGDFPRALGHSLRNPRDSAGSWPSNPRVSEPETSGSGPGRHRIPRLSLLPSWAVRIRSRFAAALKWTLGPLRIPSLGARPRTRSHHSAVIGTACGGTPVLV